MSLETRNIEFACEKHGPQIIHQAKLTGMEWLPTRCEQCQNEKQQEWERLQREDETRYQKENREKIARNNLLNAKIPKRFAEASLASFHPDNPKAQKIHATCADYARQFLEHKAAGQGIIMCGNAGSGKTHLACGIATYTIREYATSALYTTASRAFRRVKDTYRRDSSFSEEQEIAAFVGPDLLILDEIGVQYGSATELNILFDIVNERYERMLPTILISNLALPKLTEYAGERVIDRMKENGGKLLVFDWKSHRGA